MRFAALMTVAIVVAACSTEADATPAPVAPQPTRAPAASVAPTPRPTQESATGAPSVTVTAVPELSPSATAWRLTVSERDTSYTSDVALGEIFEMEVTVSNEGAAANPGTRFQFDGLGDYADLKGCIPACSVIDLFGIYADFPGIPPGESATYRFGFVAKGLGVADWLVCIYDEAGAGEQVWCGDASTAITS